MFVYIAPKECGVLKYHAHAGSNRSGHVTNHRTVCMTTDREGRDRAEAVSRKTRGYLNPPVAGGAVINSHRAISQGIAKPAAMHMAQRCYGLYGEGQRDSMSCQKYYSAPVDHKTDMIIHKIRVVMRLQIIIAALFPV